MAHHQGFPSLAPNTFPAPLPDFGPHQAGARGDRRRFPHRDCRVCDLYLCFPIMHFHTCSLSPPSRFPLLCHLPCHCPAAPSAQAWAWLAFSSGTFPGFAHCCPLLSCCPGLLLAIDFLYYGFSKSQTDSQQGFPNTRPQPGCPAAQSLGQAEPRPNPGAPAHRQPQPASACFSRPLPSLPGTPRQDPTH